VEAPPEGTAVSRAAAVLGALVLFAGTARAGSTKWTVPAAAGWTDITADALKEPQLVGYKKTISDNGGSFELTSFADAGGTVVAVMTVEVPKMTTLADLDAFEAGARGAAKTAGPEIAYTKQVAPTHWSVTQHIGAAEPIATRRFEGFLKRGGMRTVSVNCYGASAVCDPLLASATFNTAELQVLAAADTSEKKPLSYQLGYFLGSASLLLALLWWWKQRRNRAA
jgi:hypothetical protein